MTDNNKKFKFVHFRLDYDIWLKMRQKFPEKGDVQRICRQALVEFLEKQGE